MISYLDLLDLKIRVVRLDPNIPDSIITKILNDEQFNNFDFGMDIYYILSRSYINIENTNKTQQADIEQWVSNFVDQLRRLSNFTYTDDEILLYKKYFYYNTVSRVSNLGQNFEEILSLLSIPVSKNGMAWLAKENLRIAFLTGCSFALKSVNLNIIQEQLTIARSAVEHKKELEELLETIIAR